MEGRLMITEAEKICQYIYDLAVEFKEEKRRV
jgi:hypothetical protein